MNLDMCRDPRESDRAYTGAMDAAGWQKHQLDFYFFCGAALPARYLNLEIPVGDITTLDRAGVLEAKTKEDLVGSFRTGRLAWQLWYLYVLRIAHFVRAAGVIVRESQRFMNEHVRPEMWLAARQFLFARAHEYGLEVLWAEEPEDVVKVSESWMRHVREYTNHAPPAPYIPATVFDWPFAVQVLCLIPGIGLELAKQLASKKDLYGMIVDTHDMGEDAFVIAYNDIYNFGGKEGKRLRSIHKSFMQIPAFPPEDTNTNTFQMQGERHVGT
jgi:ERCC4-type nuclease